MLHRAGPVRGPSCGPFHRDATVRGSCQPGRSLDDAGRTLPPECVQLCGVPAVVGYAGMLRE